MEAYLAVIIANYFSLFNITLEETRQFQIDEKQRVSKLLQSS